MEKKIHLKGSISLISQDLTFHFLSTILGKKGRKWGINMKRGGKVKIKWGALGGGDNEELREKWGKWGKMTDTRNKMEVKGVLFPTIKVYIKFEKGQKAPPHFHDIQVVLRGGCIWRIWNISSGVIFWPPDFPLITLPIQRTLSEGPITGCQLVEDSWWWIRRAHVGVPEEVGEVLCSSPRDKKKSPKNNFKFKI